MEEKKELVQTKGTKASGSFKVNKVSKVLLEYKVLLVTEFKVLLEQLVQPVM